MTTTVSFDRLEHLVRVPVEIAGETYRFLVDTGCGQTVVSSAVPSVPLGLTASGRRMSGQEIVSPLSRLPYLAMGSFRVVEPVVAVADLDSLSGILAFDLFEEHVVTTDPVAMTLTIQSPASFSPSASAVEVPLEIVREDRSVSLNVKLVLPSGREILVELDTGSGNLILDSRYMPECGVDPAGPGVETKTGLDETGHEYTRRWSPITGSVHLAGARETAQAAPRTQFQDIILEGLIGTAFLDRYRYSVDIPGSRLVLEPL